MKQDEDKDKDQKLEERDGRYFFVSKDGKVVQEKEEHRQLRESHQKDKK